MVISVLKFLHSLIMKVIIAILLGYLSLCGFAYISVINNDIGYLSHTILIIYRSVLERYLFKFLIIFEVAENFGLNNSLETGYT